VPGIAASIWVGWLLGAGSEMSAQNCGKVSFGLMLVFMVVLSAVKV
jgi:Na+-driven multidrug efflux pump